MNFGIPPIFAYFDTAWQVAAFLLAFGAGYITGGIVQR